MTTTDWIIDITLVAIVLRQIHEAPIDRRFVLLPAAIIAFTAHKYLHAIPTGGNDLLLIAAGLGLGATLGVAGGFATHVRVADGQGYARAGVVAAGLWVVSMSARLVFIIWITHSAGAAALARFSMAHDITGAHAWQDALILLALSEATVRLAIIIVRSELAKRAPAPAQQLVAA